MRFATKAATDAAKATRDSVTLARDNAHLDQRAWVAVDSTGGIAKENEPFTVTISVKNTGKTFAKDFTGVTRYVLKEISDPDPDFESIIATDSQNNSSPGLIAPNAIFNQFLDVPDDGRKMNRGDIETLSDPTRILLIFGKIKYSDIFKCEHWTTFCFRAYPTKGRYDVYGPYNNADDNECK